MSHAVLTQLPVRREPDTRARSKSDVDRGSHPPVVQHFFITLQQDLHEWISLGPTKTGMVYRLKGHAVERHE